MLMRQYSIVIIIWQYGVIMWLLLSRNDIFMSGCGAVYTSQGTNFLSKVICINDVMILHYNVKIGMFGIIKCHFNIRI